MTVSFSEAVFLFLYVILSQPCYGIHEHPTDLKTFNLFGA